MKNWAIKQQLVTALSIYDSVTNEDVATVKDTDNAQLIAAAPEMLAALEQVQRYYTLLGTTGSFKDELDAVIKKAKGEL